MHESDVKTLMLGSVKLVRMSCKAHMSDQRESCGIPRSCDETNTPNKPTECIRNWGSTLLLRETKPNESQPINQPTNRPKKQNRPTHQPTNPQTQQPTNPPTDQPTNRPTDQPTNPPTHQPTHQPANPPTNPPTHQPTNKPINQPTDQPTIHATSMPTFLGFRILSHQHHEPIKPVSRF